MSPNRMGRVAKLGQLSGVRAQPGTAKAGSVSGIRVPERRTPGVWVPSSGPLNALTFLVGERPGEKEAQSGRPFCGPSGEILDRALDTAGMDRALCYTANLVRDWLPANPEPERWEVERDAPKLLAEIRQVDPRVIVAVGAHAARYFLGPELDMEMACGVPFWWTHPDGGTRYPVVPVYHPANAFYHVTLLANLIDGLRQVPLVIAGVLQPIADAHPAPAYTVIRDADWQVQPRLLLTANPLVAIDTEGSFLHPWCLSYSQQAGTATVLRELYGEFREELQCHIDAGGQVLLHNSLHDLSVLRSLGIDLPQGSFIDTMVLAYLLCLEPQGLKPLARRHAGMTMSSYDELLAPAAADHALHYILHAYARSAEWPETPPYLVWERDKVSKTFLMRIRKPWPIARYLKVLVADWESGKRDKAGKLVDVRARWGKIEPDIRGPVEAALGPMPEATLDDIPEAAAIHYAARDADATLRLYPHLAQKIHDRALDGTAQLDHAIIPMVERMQSNGFLADVPHFARLSVKLADLMDTAKVTITRLTGAEINPGSSDQVADLLFNQLGMKSLKKTDGGKDSTQDKVLEAMRYAHPVMPPILDYRECSKIKSTYCDPLPQLVARDGRVHTTLRITRVPSGRLASSNPNLMAQPVRSELGVELRHGFIAPDPCPCHGRPVVLADWDLDQAEMRDAAHESGDAFMCELFQDPRRDIHSETAALAFGVAGASWQNGYSGVDKLKHRYPAKRIGFGVLYGITGLGLSEQLAMAGATQNGLLPGQGGVLWTEDDCERLIREWFAIYPGVERFIEQAKQEARTTGMVRDSWGRIRYLPGVYSSKRHQRQEAERQAANHKIQGGAQGLIKRAMAAIWPYNLELERAGVHCQPLLQVHDSLIYEIDADWFPYWDQVMVNCMCTTTRLRIPMRAKGGKGRTWGDLAH